MLLPAKKCNVQNKDKCELTILFSLDCRKLIDALLSPVSTFDPEISFCFAVASSSSVREITCMITILAQVQYYCYYILLNCKIHKEQVFVPKKKKTRT